MPANEITLVMLQTELQRQRKEMLSTYPQLVKEAKLTPWERDNRISCNAKLLSLVQQAIDNKKMNGPKLLQILNQQP